MRPLNAGVNVSRTCSTSEVRFDHAAVDLDPADARKTQQVVDQLSHAGNGDLDEAYVFGIVRILAAAQPFLQQRDEPGYLPQRRAQVVADGVAERLELGVGRRELLDAFGELFVQLPDALLGLTALLDLRPERAALAKQFREHGDFRAQHGRLDRLGQEVDSAGLIPGDRAFVAVRGQEQDRDVLRLPAAANDLGQLDPAHAGHLHVQHDRRVVFREQRQQRVLPAQRAHQMIAGRFEDALQREQVLRLVVNEQDVDGLFLRHDRAHRYSQTRSSDSSCSVLTGFAM